MKQTPNFLCPFIHPRGSVACENRNSMQCMSSVAWGKCMRARNENTKSKDSLTWDSDHSFPLSAKGNGSRRILPKET